MMLLNNKSFLMKNNIQCTCMVDIMQTSGSQEVN